MFLIKIFCSFQDLNNNITDAGCYGYYYPPQVGPAGYMDNTSVITEGGIIDSSGLYQPFHELSLNSSGYATLDESNNFMQTQAGTYEEEQVRI